MDIGAADKPVPEGGEVGGENPGTTGLPNENRRKQAFFELVTIQDESGDVEESRKRVSRDFEISLDQVRLIEEEGLEKGWPPL